MVEIAEPPLPAAPPSEFTGISARLRVLEERQGELRKKLLFVEQNLLSNHKRSSSDIKSLHDELTQVHHQLKSVDDNFLSVVKELRLLAKKEDVDVLRKYLDYWKPVRFVTFDQVEKMIREALEKRDGNV